MRRNPIIAEPLYKEVEFYPWEVKLFQTSYVRRLKYLAHFGGGAYVSPVVHSRYEHTVGVWKLAAVYFPNHPLLRAAAILHDIGHLPFSHAVEKTLGYNHQALTEEYIQSPEIVSILHTANLEPSDITLSPIAFAFDRDSEYIRVGSFRQLFTRYLYEWQNRRNTERIDKKNPLFRARYRDRRTNRSSITSVNCSRS
ncbi:HD domain-containing protein [Virgibacillus sp. 6R]|uniref:HD domain-containing protein n=1 Tax=Virgibacillus sp. 6R TaxID=1911587 RepID=UPI000A971516|nr:HD domain-containing protein [Virgibacillus sp. 6R]